MRRKSRSSFPTVSKSVQGGRGGSVSRNPSPSHYALCIADLADSETTGRELDAAAAGCQSSGGTADVLKQEYRGGRAGGVGFVYESFS